MNDARQLVAPALLIWHQRAGRHDLPWQHPRTPYRVWVSEIMLQQTQVTTVIPFYQRFMARFPDLPDLAAAPLDAVLAAWSGLGYYARARNLHRAACQVVAGHGGELPTDFDRLAALPGIGRSTAGAILALSAGARHPILDGNVRRVLARIFLVDGDPAARATLERLWILSAECMPAAEVATYTQAIMDLGATVCSRRQPDCAACPLAGCCGAWAAGRQHELPAPRRRAVRPVRDTLVLLARTRDGGVLLERRPEHGIWGGLWSLPEFGDEATLEAYARSRLRDVRLEPRDTLLPLRHGFTHFDLMIRPRLASCAGLAGEVREAAREFLWYKPPDPGIGVPAPVRALLETLASEPPLLALRSDDQ